MDGPAQSGGLQDVVYPNLGVKGRLPSKVGAIPLPTWGAQMGSRPSLDRGRAVNSGQRRATVDNLRKQKSPGNPGLFRSGRCWARTSGLRLVEAEVSGL